MKLLFALVCLLLAPCSSSAIEASQVECTAWTHDQSQPDSAIRIFLKKSDFDPQYYHGEIGHYSFGADYSYLSNGGIGLIVFDNKSKRFSESTPGFRRIGNSKVRESDLKFYDRIPDGRTVVAGIQCGYSTP
ncbi:MAG: hypothetical protein AB7N80_12360 [Bdellovibrionales bacterium]